MLSRPSYRIGRTLVSAAVAATLAALAPTSTVLAQEGTPPGVRFGEAPLISPASAASYYGGLPAAATYPWGDARPPEITETAVALGNDPDRLFAFVRNNIRIVPIYGLQKGAVGALVDRSGTSFDQAQLLVELLRAAGHPSARYVLTDLTLTGAQLNDWLGVSTAAAATDLLANGGIPASVVGSGAVASVTLSHVVVQVEVQGATRTYDPSYKPSDASVPLDAKAAAGFSRSAFVSTAIGGSSIQVENGAPYITAVNLSGIQANLGAGANALLTQLRTNYGVRSADDLLGVRRIRRVDAPETVPVTGVLGAGQAFTGGLPDRYRTRLSIMAGSCNRSFFVDEIYGRRITLHREVSGVSPANGVYVDGKLVGATCGNPQDTGVQSVPITLAVDHPYAAQSGTYMDATTIKYVDRSDDVVIVHGWGDTSNDLQAKLGLEAPTERDEKIPDPAEDTSSPDGGGAFIQTDAGTTQVSMKSKLGASWLAQSTRAADIIQAVSGVRFQHHHTLGVAYSQAHYFVYDTNKNRVQDPGEEMLQGEPRDSALRLDLDAGYSTTRISADGADQIAARHTLAAAMATLEGSVMEQQLDAVDTASTAQRLPWGQENLSNSIRYHLFAAGAAAPVVASYNTGGAPSGRACVGADLTAQGFTVIQANDRMMGPGQPNPVPTIWTNRNPWVPQTSATMHRGCAWIAFTADASHIAHVVTSLDRGLKGGGAGDDSSLKEGFKPEKQADLLKDQYKDRSSVNGVDIRTGAFTFTPPEDLKIGSGDFPYSLSFQRSFQAGGPRCAGCPFGWTHNFDIRAAASGGGMEGMGATNALTLAGPWMAIEGAFALYRDNPNSVANQVAAAGVMRWFAGRLSGNVVSLTQGPSSETFVKLVDGTFASPVGSGSQLTQIGARRTTLEQGARSLTWLYDQVSFRRRSRAGDELSLTWREWNPSHDGSAYVLYPKAKAFGFLATTWTWPKGVSLSFTYCEGSLVIPLQRVPACRDRLTRVTNSLGYYLDIDRLSAVSSDGRTTSMPIPSPTGGGEDWEAAQPTSLTDSGGRIWSFQWRRAGGGGGDRPSPYPYLTRIYAPDDANVAQQEIVYDRMNRVRTLRDRLTIAGARGVQQIMAAGYGEGRAIDPEGGVLRIVYDEDDRVIRQIDELGRATATSYDGAGRVLSRTLPEGDRVLFAYDGRDNVTELRRVAKPGSNLADVVVTAAYDPTWNRPLWIREARNNDPGDPAWNLRTDYTYVSSGGGAGEIRTVTQPAVSGVRPVWGYEYTNIGLLSKVTDPAGLVTVTTYDARGNPTLTRVDPTGVNARTCRAFDAIGNVISETGPLAGVCP